MKILFCEILITVSIPCLQSGFHQAYARNRYKEGIRSLTTIERSYIQTFPRGFKFFGNKTDMEQMIGNAVPVNLAYDIAKEIYKGLEIARCGT